MYMQLTALYYNHPCSPLKHFFFINTEVTCAFKMNIQTIFDIMITPKNTITWWNFTKPLQNCKLIMKKKNCFNFVKLAFAPKFSGALNWKNSV